VRLDALKRRQRRDADRSCKISQAQAADRGVTRQRFARSQALAEDRGDVDRGLQHAKLKKQRQKRR